MRCSNKERKKVACYFLLSKAVTCVLGSQFGFLYVMNAYAHTKWKFHFIPH
uniref:hypothetical protein n=1 Tax=Bacillus cytotoxicus TaxID=580165 RepID=UPI00203FE228